MYSPSSSSSRACGSRSLEPGQVERGVDRARGDGALGARVVVGGRYRHDPVPVAVGGLEDGAGDIGPGLDGAGAGAVVGAVGGVRPQHVEDGLGHVAREGQAAQLVVNDRDLRELILRVATRSDSPFMVLTKLCPSPMTQELRMM